MRANRLTLLLALVCSTGLLPAGTSAADLTPEQVEFFESKVRPVLADHCYGCHSGTSKDLKASFRLDFRDGLLKGGMSGKPAVVAGNPDASPLIQAIKRVDPKTAMPPKADKALTPAQISDLENWVRMGAPDPRPTPAGGLVDPASKAKAHWAFKRPVEPNIPQVKTAGWANNDLDRFVLAKLEAKQLAPAQPADKVALIRRATFDLHGLPPTTQEIDAFVNDPSADAFAKVVDRLLASPRYGERWGRYWLDVARYADTKGYVFEEERRYPYSYTYRDWVIRSLNADLPYDQFLVHQIAADRVPDNDKSNQAALGFLTIGRRFLNVQPDIMDDRIDVVTRGTMALTVQCARCHDHKYDPIPTADYYSLYGIFASSPEAKEPPVVGKLQEEGNDAKAYQDELKKREAEVEKFLKEKHAELTKQFRSAESIATYLTAIYDLRNPKGEDRRNYIQQKDLRRQMVDRYSAFVDATKENPAFWPVHAFLKLKAEDFENTAPYAVDAIEQNVKDYPLNPLVRDLFVGKPAPKSFREVAERYGKLLAESDKPEPHGDKDREALRNLLRNDNTPTAIAVADVQSFFRRDEQGRYRDLRKKVDELNATHPGAPARAMAVEDMEKPVDQRVFVRGNPGSLGDLAPRQFLGVLAGPERKPFTNGSGRLELAQAIASKDNPLTARVMVNRVWLNHFGQGLVTTPSDFGLRSDPPSHPELLDYLSLRFVEDGWSLKKLHRRLMLSATYQQDSTGNPAFTTIDPENRLLWRQNRRRLDFEALRDNLIAVTGRMDFTMGGKGVELTANPSPLRRTVYGYIERQNLPGLFRTFDLASPDTHSPQRFFTTVPQQALFMMNSPFVIDQAKALAARPDVAAETDPAKRVALLYRLVYGRAPGDDDVKLAVEFTRGEDGPATSASPWVYGYGRYDEQKQRVAKFEKLPTFANGSWQGGPTVPDKKLGWLTLGAHGGHPDAGDERSVIRRFVVPADGVLSIDGQLRHTETPGNGVRGRIVSSRSGELASFAVHKSEAITKLDNLDVKTGDTVDFVVDSRGDIGWDSFTWNPTLRLTRPQLADAAGNEGVKEYNAANDFAGPVTGGKLNAWEKYCQVLLESNEFAFVD